MPEPIIALSPNVISVTGGTLELHEWSGSGPPYLHVHHRDDEAWHVLEGTLHFRFVDSELEVSAGGSVFVPAGVAHTYTETGGPSRYLMILTPTLGALIRELHETPFAGHGEVMKRYDSEILE